MKWQQHNMQETFSLLIRVQYFMLSQKQEVQEVKV